LSLSNVFRPLQLTDIIGQGLGMGSELDVLISRLKLNIPNRSLWVEGPPGSGKTSVVESYVRTVLCRRRPAGSHIACGECAVCTAPSLSQISSDVIYYSCTTPDDAKTEFAELSRFCNCPPVWSPDTREDQNLKFIIIDEVQNSSTTQNDRISLLLDVVERSVPTTVWIFITSHPEKLNDKSYSAISSRCHRIPFRALQPEVMAERLHRLGRDISMEAALLLASLCNGNMRQLWSEYEYMDINRQAQGIPINVETIYRAKAGGATDRERSWFWRLLQAGEYAEASAIVTSWCQNSGNPAVVGRLLIRDLNSRLLHPGAAQCALELAKWISRGAHMEELPSILRINRVEMPLTVPSTFRELVQCCT